MFKDIVYRGMKKCNTVEEYKEIRDMLEGYGIEKFKKEMQEANVFIGQKINTRHNPFAQMILGKKSDEFEEIDEDFILIDSPDNIFHRFLTPKILDWDTFNVLTLNKSHLPLLKRMKQIAFLYAFENRMRHFALLFHCYPFNSINSLHLHIVDTDLEPLFLHKTNNLKLDDVILHLESL